MSEIRCWDSNDPLYVDYHDREWGRPVTDERGLLERLCLEGFQSGLSWLTILRKREAFRAALANFDADAVARFGARDVTLVEARDGVGVEVRKRRSERLPFAEDRQPRQAGLEAL